MDLFFYFEKIAIFKSVILNRDEKYFSYMARDQATPALY